MWDERRMRTACLARTPQRCTSRLSKRFLLTFQEVTPLSKTRNRLHLSLAHTGHRIRGFMHIDANVDMFAGIRALLCHVVFLSRGWCSGFLKGYSHFSRHARLALALIQHDSFASEGLSGVPLPATPSLPRGGVKHAREDYANRRTHTPRGGQ